MNWTKTWKASVKPSKQRLYVRNAPAHTRNKLMGSHLTKELKQKLNTRSIPARKGDTVKILRGEYQGKTGKIERVDTEKIKVYVTGAEKIRKDGSKALYPIHPSKIMIQELAPDKRRTTQKTGGEQK